jgi:hypothetical protein
VVLLVAGFVGVRTSADVIDEISYLVTGGIGSIFLLGVGATLLLSADLHDDFRKLHRVEEKLDRVERLLLAEHPDLVDVADRPPDTDAATTGPGAPPPSPVRRGRLVAGIGTVVAGALFVAGSLRTAHQASTDHMAGGVGVALGGALVVALLAALTVAQLRVSMEQRKAAVFGSWLAEEPAGGSTAVATGGSGSVFVVGGLPLYHRAGCQLLAGRAATEVDPAALPAGVVPCRLCEPN